MQANLSQLSILGILSAVSLAASVRLHDNAPLLAKAFTPGDKPLVRRVPEFVAYDVNGGVLSVEKGQRYLLVYIPSAAHGQLQMDVRIWSTLARDGIAVRAYCLTEPCDTSVFDEAGIRVAHYGDWRTQRLLAAVFDESFLVLVDEGGLVIGRGHWVTLNSDYALQLWLSELKSRR